ncbi:MAG: DNA translocase FtsK [Firmicutes bacterium]|nr:DNA translocase FtsK [Bacillota bacterium]
MSRLKDRFPKDNSKGNREIAGMLIAFAAVIIFLATLTGPAIFGNMGHSFSQFFIGVFGYAVFPILILVAAAGYILTRNQPIKAERSTIFCLLGLFVVGVTILQLAFSSGLMFTSGGAFIGYGAFLDAVYNTPTAGGAVFGTLGYVLATLITVAGSYVFLAIAAMTFSLLLANKLDLSNILPSRSGGGASGKDKSNKPSLKERLSVRFMGRDKAKQAEYPEDPLAHFMQGFVEEPQAVFQQRAAGTDFVPPSKLYVEEIKESEYLKHIKQQTQQDRQSNKSTDILHPSRSKTAFNNAGEQKPNIFAKVNPHATGAYTLTSQDVPKRRPYTSLMPESKREAGETLFTRQDILSPQNSAVQNQGWSEGASFAGASEPKLFFANQNSVTTFKDPQRSASSVLFDSHIRNGAMDSSMQQNNAGGVVGAYGGQAGGHIAQNGQTGGQTGGQTVQNKQTGGYSTVVLEKIHPMLRGADKDYAKEMAEFLPQDILTAKPLDVDTRYEQQLEYLRSIQDLQVEREIINGETLSKELEFKKREGITEKMPPAHLVAAKQMEQSEQSPIVLGDSFSEEKFKGILSKESLDQNNKELTDQFLKAQSNLSINSLDNLNVAKQTNEADVQVGGIGAPFLLHEAMLKKQKQDKEKQSKEWQDNTTKDTNKDKDKKEWQQQVEIATQHSFTGLESPPLEKVENARKKKIVSKADVAEVVTDSRGRSAQGSAQGNANSNQYVRPDKDLLTATAISSDLKTDREKTNEKGRQLQAVLNNFHTGATVEGREYKGIFEDINGNQLEEVFVGEVKRFRIVNTDIVLESGAQVLPKKDYTVTVGPSVSRFQVSMGAGHSVKKILQYQDDIAMTLATKSIRIETPIPGTNKVGIEVKNDDTAQVGLREILEGKNFSEASSPITFGLGKAIDGDLVTCDIASMPHLLVAGATGSGKSVCLNTIILSLIYKAGPDDVRLILIDPKRVELNVYEGLPHLLMENVITDPTQAVNAFDWAIKEMDRRYNLFRDNKARDIHTYNTGERVLSGEGEKLPYIVIIVDELADLMMTAKRDIEDKIKRLSQLARAAGIHLVIATQRPSVDVITGTIKANLPSRIAFAVSSTADSQTILNQGGADKLLGRGDMLYFPNNFPEPQRIQGAFVSLKEVEKVVAQVKERNEANFDDTIAKEIVAAKAEPEQIEMEGVGARVDIHFVDAIRICVDAGYASVSLLQRKLGIGYQRAARLIDDMEGRGYISGWDGNKPRSILITDEQLAEVVGEQEEDTYDDILKD